MKYIASLSCLLLYTRNSKGHLHDLHQGCKAELHNNGICDWLQNVPQCDYDGGDCCMESCKLEEHSHTHDDSRDVNELCVCGESLKLPQCGEWLPIDCQDPNFSEPREEVLEYKITLHTGNTHSMDYTGSLEISLVGEPRHFCLENKIAKSTLFDFTEPLHPSSTVVINPKSDNVERVSYVKLRNMDPEKTFVLQAGMIIDYNNEVFYYAGNGILKPNGENTVMVKPGGGDLVWYNITIQFGDEADAGFEDGTLSIQMEDLSGRKTVLRPLLYGPVKPSSTFTVPILAQAMVPAEIELILKTNDETDSYHVLDVEVKLVDTQKKLLGDFHTAQYDAYDWLEPNVLEEIDLNGYRETLGEDTTEYATTAPWEVTKSQEVDIDLGPDYRRAVDRNSQHIFKVHKYKTNRYPDMEPDAIQMLRNMVYTVVDIDDDDLKCATEECLLPKGSYLNGEKVPDVRKLLRFETTVWNIGKVDMYPPPNNDPEWHSCHNHWHALIGFTRYTVTPAGTYDGSLLKLVKNSHCAVDSYCNRGESDKKFKCVNQGISKGCADRYGEWLDCQWVELTTLETGWYNLNVNVNSDRTLPEMDYSNNEVHVMFYFDSEGDVDDTIRYICFSEDEDQMKCPSKTKKFKNKRGDCYTDADCIRDGHKNPRSTYYKKGSFPNYNYDP